MPTQGIRHAKLLEVLAELEQAGYWGLEAQALYIGGSTTVKRLEAMLAGADIPAMFAAHIEHVMLKPRGWMSTRKTSEPSPAPLERL